MCAVVYFTYAVRCFFFFFSSRRRHTRLQGDWSSDVCSSDLKERKVWVCKPLGGQAIRTSHARLITGSDNATSTVWKDRFLCYWFYTPNTGEEIGRASCRERV